MIDNGKKSVVGVLVDAVDSEAAVARIMEAASSGKSFGVSALAVHGVMTGVDQPEYRYRLNHLDLVTADGQPVRWVLNMLHHVGLPDKVGGPTLTLNICRAAAARGLPVFFYGSRPEVLRHLTANLASLIPTLTIAGTEPSKFRSLRPGESAELVSRIRESGARITFVGLGCPRQEVFVHEFSEPLGMPVLAVGAAFDYHAGFAKEPCAWVQRFGLQWLHRLVRDPRRLWRRYLILNPRFIGRVAMQSVTRSRDQHDEGVEPTRGLPVPA